MLYFIVPFFSLCVSLDIPSASLAFFTFVIVNEHLRRDERVTGRRRLIWHTRAQSGLTALIGAAIGGHSDCARLLLEAGADKEAKTEVRRVFDRVVMVATMLANFLSFVQSISCLFSFSTFSDPQFCNKTISYPLC
jgi:hypothetical protein